MPFVVSFPYQFFNFDGDVVDPITLTDSVQQDITHHFDEIDDELEVSNSMTEGRYHLEGFSIVSVDINPRSQAVDLEFEGEGDRQSLAEYISLKSMFGGGEFLAAEDVMIKFYENQYSGWDFLP